MFDEIAKELALSLKYLVDGGGARAAAFSVSRDAMPGTCFAILALP
jgi:hypothetical protein